jgi:3-deoxy-D-manno-octulosonate 8-phosphate phosphatase (KDO 8-P phosphatase)
MSQTEEKTKKNGVVIKFKKIRMLIMDVDGVLTEGGIVLGGKGQELKVFDVQDGMGITLARMGGIKVGIITGRQSESVLIRAQELHFDALVQNARNKLDAYKNLLERYDLKDAEICYIGDDLLDLSVMECAGVSIAVANARSEVKKKADYVTRNRGGHGAVREIVEQILKAQRKWDAVLRRVINGDLE